MCKKIILITTGSKINYAKKLNYFINCFKMYHSKVHRYIDNVEKTVKVKKSFITKK